MLLNFLTLIIVSMLCCHAVIIIHATPRCSLSLFANPLNRYLLIHSLYSHIHTHTHTYIHTYTHTSIHTYRQTYIHTYIHTHIHTFTHTDTHTYMHTLSHTLTHARSFTTALRQDLTSYACKVRYLDPRFALEEEELTGLDTNCARSKRSKPSPWEKILPYLLNPRHQERSFSAILESRN